MEQLKFEQIPEAVGQIFEKLNKIEIMLANREGSLTPKGDEILTIKEAGKFLSLTVNTIYGLTRNAKIPFCKRGKRLYFIKDDLIAWLKLKRKSTKVEIENSANNYLSPKLKGGKYEF